MKKKLPPFYDDFLPEYPSPWIGAIKRPENVKRVTTKTGEVRYYDQDKKGKRLPASTGAPAWIKKNFEDIKGREVKALTDRERRSFQGRLVAEKNRDKLSQAAKERLRFGGRMVPKYLDKIISETALKLLGREEKELKKVFPDVRDYGDLLKKAQSLISTNVLPKTEWALPNEKRRRENYSNVIDIATRLSEDPVYSSLKLVVIDSDGSRYEKKGSALEAVRDWENDRIEEIMRGPNNPAYTKFQHFAEIDVEDGTLTIDMRESTSQTQTSP